MKATWTYLAVLLATGGFCSVAAAHKPLPCTPPTSPPFFYQHPPAPDACGPGFWCTGYTGMAYGPSYCLRPPWPPYNGERPCIPGKGRPAPFGPSPEMGAGGVLGFPTHPFARSPRDFFMVGD